VTEQGDFIDNHGIHTSGQLVATGGSESVAIVEIDRGALEPTAISVNDTVRRLRSVLKDRYPDTRFKVRVTRDVEGSIDIEWTSGPLADEVVTIARDYISADYRRGRLPGAEGTDVDQLGPEMNVEDSRYDVSRIEVCRLKADGSVDATRLIQTHEIE